MVFPMIPATTLALAVSARSRAATRIANVVTHNAIDAGRNALRPAKANTVITFENTTTLLVNPEMPAFSATVANIRDVNLWVFDPTDFLARFVFAFIEYSRHGYFTSANLQPRAVQIPFSMAL